MCCIFQPVVTSQGLCCINGEEERDDDDDPFILSYNCAKAVAHKRVQNMYRKGVRATSICPLYHCTERPIYNMYAKKSRHLRTDSSVFLSQEMNIHGYSTKPTTIVHSFIPQIVSHIERFTTIGRVYACGRASASCKWDKGGYDFLKLTRKQRVRD